jgi:V8-like Glu-specific endopeptidase
MLRSHLLFSIIVPLAVGLLPHQTRASLLSSLAEPKVNAFIRSELLKKSEKTPHAIRTLDKSAVSGTEEKVLTYYWPVGHEIKIGFLGGDQASRDLIKKTVQDWLAAANLKFTYVDEMKKAEVRIQINKQFGASYSYLGTTALTAPKAESTMVLSLADQTTAEKKGIILHEFGHMLGLPAENQNPNSESHVDWDKFYQFAAQSWNYSKETVDANYRPSPLTSYLYARKPFDPSSIMMHPIPREAMIGDEASTWRLATDLSNGDKQFISQIYPKDSKTLEQLRTVISTVPDKTKDALGSSLEKVKIAEKTKQDTALLDSVTPPELQAPSLSPKKLDERVTQSDQIQLQIIRNYVTAKAAGGLVDAAQFAKLYVEAREENKQARRDKAIYGLDNQYSPDTYKQIYDKAPSVGYLSNGLQRLGTCFMIGKDLVLTCYHCLKIKGTLSDTYAPVSLKVRFGKGDDPAHEETFGVEKIVYQGQSSPFGGIPLQRVDFALLELKRGIPSGKLPSEMGIGKLAINEDPRPQRDTPLYVIGYPGLANKTVADNAHIFAGFDTSDDEKTGFELEARNEAARMVLKANERNKDKNVNEQNLMAQLAERQGKEMMANFEASFKRGTGPDARWYMISQLIQTPAQPAFFLDSDTYHGNSGSPVFSRISSEVTGVLHRGMDDHFVGLQPGWLQHEEAMPIHVIMQNWKDNAPDQLARYEVTF